MGGWGVVGGGGGGAVAKDTTRGMPGYEQMHIGDPQQLRKRAHPPAGRCCCVKCCCDPQPTPCHSLHPLLTPAAGSPGTSNVIE